MGRNIMRVIEDAGHTARKGIRMNGILGGMFDLNGDGKLDAWEQAAEFAFLSSIADDDHDELYRVGIDLEGLELMSDGERRTVL